MSKETLGSFCPRCGKDVSKDIIRCSNCGAPISSDAPRSGMLLASGVLSFIAASLFLLGGILSPFSFLQTFRQATIITPSGPIYPQLSLHVEELGILGAANLLSFGLSLTGGVLTLDRNHLIWVFRVFLIAIVAPIVPFGVSFPTAPEFLGVDLILLYFITFSLPAICLDAVSLIFVGLRRDDFLKN